MFTKALVPEVTSPEVTDDEDDTGVCPSFSNGNPQPCGTSKGTLTIVFVHVYALFIFLFYFFLQLFINKKISEQRDASLNTRAISLIFHATIFTQISIGSTFSYHIKQKAKQCTDQSYSVCVRRVSF